MTILRRSRVMSLKHAKVVPRQDAPYVIGLKEVEAHFKRPASVNLMFAERITTEAAMALSAYDGLLMLDSLREITAEQARFIVGHRGGLSLRGLQEVDEDLALLLAKTKGMLYLDGLSRISVGAFEKLCNNRHGISDIDPGCKSGYVSEVQKLFEPAIDICLYNKYNTRIQYQCKKRRPMNKCCDELTRGLEKSGKLGLSLNGLPEIGLELASVIGKFKGLVLLLGLKEVDLPCARALMENEKAALGCPTSHMFPEKIDASHFASYSEGLEKCDFSKAKSIHVDVAQKFIEYDPTFKLKSFGDLRSTIEMANKYKQQMICRGEDAAAIERKYKEREAANLQYRKKREEVSRKIKKAYEHGNAHLKHSSEEDLLQETDAHLSGYIFDESDTDDREEIARDQASEDGEYNEDASRSHDEGWFYKD